MTPPDKVAGVLEGAAWPGCYAVNCDRCGRFTAQDAPGGSWSRTWQYDMSGCPELNDPVFRCQSCTKKHGVGFTNCAPGYPGNGLNPARQPASRDGDGA